MTGLMRGALACGALALLGACHMAPARRSLADQPSSFKENGNAPVSSWREAGSDSGTSLGGPASTFRAAEIPPEHLERTTALLSDFKARQLPDSSIIIALPADILFDFDKADLRPDGIAALARMQELLEGYPDAPLEVIGHTDSKGDDSYNNALSLRRAQTVAQWLDSHAARTATTSGAGERQPVAPNTTPDGSDDPAGRQRNRRVEIIIKPARAP